MQKSYMTKQIKYICDLPPLRMWNFSNISWRGEGEKQNGYRLVSYREDSQTINKLDYFHLGGLLPRDDYSNLTDI